MKSNIPRHWLKNIRNKLGLTQIEMASFLEIPKTTYSSYEQGYRDPEISNAKIMAKRLKVKWPIFFEDYVRESDYKNALKINVKEVI